MTEQQRYRVVGDNHYHDGDRLRTGDVFTPTEDELAAFGHKFEPVGDAEDVAPEDEAEAEAETGAEADDEAQPEPDASDYEAVSEDEATDDSEPEPELEGETEPEPEDLADEDEEICGEEMSSGEICQRPASTCPYHGG